MTLPMALIYQFMYHRYRVPQKLVEIQAHCSLFQKRQVWLHLIFIEEFSANLSGCGALINFKCREVQIFFNLFSYLHIILLERRNPKREIGRSGTVQLCLTRPGPQQ